MSYQPPPNIDPPPQPGSAGAHEGRWADALSKEESRHRLGIAGQVCGYVSLGLSGGPYIIAVLFNLSPDIGIFLPTVGAFVGLPLSVVGIVLSVLGLRSLFDKKTAITGLIICFIAFVLTLVIVIATLLSPK